MTTLLDVAKAYHDERQFWTLFSVSEERKGRVRDAFTKVGAAIMKENGLSPKEAMSLSADTALGPKAQAEFEQFLAVIAEGHDRQA